MTTATTTRPARHDLADALRTDPDADLLCAAHFGIVPTDWTDPPALILDDGHRWEAGDGTDPAAHRLTLAGVRADLDVHGSWGCWWEPEADEQGPQTLHVMALFNHPPTLAHLSSIRHALTDATDCGRVLDFAMLTTDADHSDQPAVIVFDPATVTPLIRLTPPAPRPPLTAPALWTD